VRGKEKGRGIEGRGREGKGRASPPIFWPRTAPGGGAGVRVNVRSRSKVIQLSKTASIGQSAVVSVHQPPVDKKTP